MLEVGAGAVRGVDIAGAFRRLGDVAGVGGGWRMLHKGVTELQKEQAEVGMEVGMEEVG